MFIRLITVIITVLVSSAAEARNPYMAVENLDTNKDGKVGLDEWKKEQRIFFIIDKDKDNFITVDEFAAHWRRRGETIEGYTFPAERYEAPPKNPFAEIKKLDLDGDGIVRRHEMSSNKKLFYLMDLNADAVLSVDELARYLRKTGDKIEGYQFTSDISDHGAVFKNSSFELPIADVHMHEYLGTLEEAEWFKKHMLENGVRWGGAVGNYSSQMSDLLGDAYIPAFGQKFWNLAFFRDGPDALSDINNRFISRGLAKAEELFASGLIKGFGEIHTDTHQERMARHLRLLNPVTEKMMEISDRYHGFVQVHTTAHNDNLSQLENDIIYLSQKYKNSSLILSHCLPGESRDSIQVLESVFSKTQNVFCEISGNNGPVLNGVGRMYKKGGIRGNWKSFIEKYSDRVMVGSDPCCGQRDKFPALIQSIREDFLPYLSPSTREKVAYQNAVRIMGLK